MAASLMQRKLVQLTVEMTHSVVTVVVLSKSEPRYFVTDNNKYRGVINYFVRDSTQHIVNCKYWGSEEKVGEYEHSLKIGDVVDIICPRVEPCMQWLTNGENGTGTTTSQTQPKFRFQPLPTLPIALVSNEGQSTLVKHDSHDKETIQNLCNLMRVSHKEMCGVVRVADVHWAAGSAWRAHNYQAQFVDVLVVVASLRAVKLVPSRRNVGTVLKCLELVVFDKSSSHGILLSIWQPDWIYRAQQYWQPMKTVLHLIEVRVAYSQYYRNNMLNFTARSMIYENPNGRKSEELLEFAATKDMKDFNFFAVVLESIPEPEQIVTKMSVEEIYSRAVGDLSDDGNEQFTAVLYGMVSSFDINGQSPIIRKKCKSCQRPLAKAKIACDFEQCEMALSLNPNEDKYENYFSINIQFSDQSGNLAEPRLCGATAERVLGMSVTEFLRMDHAQKEAFRRRFLFEQFKVKLLIKKTTPLHKNIAITVIDMISIDLAAFAKSLAAS